jgi:hypothetical protein
MTHTEVIEAVAAAITSIQERSGELSTELVPDTAVINGLPGFDSLRGLELSVAMSRFFEVPEDANICISDDGKHALTISEIASKLEAMGQKRPEEE